ncbi:MAG: helix-turn-helix domain-containing protein [bacterium]|nr:helix-turn-helix domain-containing protein [bacterium]
MSTLGEEIIQGLRDAVEYSKGKTKGWRVHTVEVPATVDVRKIRDRLRLTQQEFADRFGFSVYSVRNWEQGRRRPEGPARVLLTIIDKEPEAALRALAA